MREEDKQTKDFSDIEERFAAEGDANSRAQQDFDKLRKIAKKPKKISIISVLYTKTR